MSEQNTFIPLSGQLGIAGSSYMLQIGKVGNFWALRLVKGADVLDSKVFKDEGAEMPNANKLTGWVLSVLAIPNINTYQIQKTIGFIRQQAMRTVEDQQSKKKSQGKSESASTHLEKPPEGQIKRSTGPGWVKAETPAEETAEATEETAENEEQPAEAEEVQSVKARADARSNAPAKAKPKAGSHRKLPPIPRGEEEEESQPVPAKANKPTKPTPAAKISNSKDLGAIGQKLDTILSRLDALKKRVTKLEGMLSGQSHDQALDELGNLDE